MGEKPPSQPADPSGTKPEELHKHRDCQDEKAVYDKCFRNWYRYSFLHKDFHDPCVAFFEEYSTCLSKSLKARGLDDLLDPENPIWKYSNN